mmetsp:Transcript_24396/g.78809  ORF Transcript_24396/g.78809 Transcript_24396/m.78809 type:complete len:220 (-) Transcript_24396:107-766(-)
MEEDYLQMIRVDYVVVIIKFPNELMNATSLSIDYEEELELDSKDEASSLRHLVLLPLLLPSPRSRTVLLRLASSSSVTAMTLAPPVRSLASAPEAVRSSASAPEPVRSSPPVSRQRRRESKQAAICSSWRSRSRTSERSLALSAARRRFSPSNSAAFASRFVDTSARARASSRTTDPSRGDATAASSRRVRECATSQRVSSSLARDSVDGGVLCRRRSR